MIDDLLLSVSGVVAIAATIAALLNFKGTRKRYYDEYKQRRQ